MSAHQVPEGKFWNYLSLVTVSGFDIVHNVDVNVVQDHTGLCEAGTLPENAPENDASLCRRDFDSGFDALEAMGSDGVYRGPLNKFEVSQGSEVEA